MTDASLLTSPPVADKRPFEITTHGHTRTDNYYWMREKSSDDVVAYLNAENAWADQKLKPIQPLIDKLYEEMIGRVKETDDTVPSRIGDFFYYSRTEKGKQYSIYCRKQGSLEAEEEVLIDLNKMAEDNSYDYLVLGIYTISPDHTRLAYGIDTTGAEAYQIRVLDVTTGELLSDIIENAAGDAVWADNNTLFYTGEEAQTRRTDKLTRHIIGTEQSDDVQVYYEPDGLYNVALDKTSDKKYVVTGSMGIETYEMHVLSVDTPLDAFQVVTPREEGMRYTVDHRDDLFYIVTNADGATNSKLMTASAEATTRDNWQPLVEHREDTRLYSVQLFANHMMRYERANGLTQLVITQFDTGETHTIAFDEPVYTVGPASNPEFNTTDLRLSYTSMKTPSSVYDYDMVTRARTLKKQHPVEGGYNADEYESERILAPAADGALVPITLVYRKDMRNADGPNLLHLYGYGSYGVTVDPYFSSNRISLMDRGMIYAIAHVRGSQMMGRQWYENGKFLHKRNTFTDFVDCAKYLIAQGYTAEKMISTEGGSAGGLLMGAVMNLAPELFKACIAKVAFVDVVTTMLDESIPLTTGEFKEWGNPKDEEYYHYMLSYSPYDNVEAKEYPAMLVTGGLNDPRVQYWEPAKWVAKLRTLKTDDNDLLLKIHMGAGHFASSGRYSFLKDVARDWAFALYQLGIRE